MKTEPLGVYEFGRRLLETNDLDPVYVVLNQAQLPRPILLRWLIAYWCFYHVGTASWIVDKGADADYWLAMANAAGSKEYPRCHERRHFRGQFALTAVCQLEEVGIDSLFRPLIGCNSSLQDVMDYVRTWYGFGDWIAFKVADMIERLGLGQVQFDNASMFLFKSPQEGARLMWEREGNGEVADVQEWAVGEILDRLGGYEAPPRYERRINAQEAETILCKWKAHVGGHYHIGEDIAAVRKGCLKFARCRTSQLLLKSMREARLECVGV